MKRRSARLAAIAAVLVLGVCELSDGPPSVPVFIGLPRTTPLNSTTMAKLYSDAPGGKIISYVIDWGDEVETSATYVAGDTAEQWHTWHEMGTFAYRAMAFYTFDTALFSGWTTTDTIRVLP